MRRRRARLARGRRPDAWLRTPRRRAPAWGNFTRSRVSVLARAPAAAPIPLAGANSPSPFFPAPAAAAAARDVPAAAVCKRRESPEGRSAGHRPGGPEGGGAVHPAAGSHYQGCLSPQLRPGSALWGPSAPPTRSPVLPLLTLTPSTLAAASSLQIPKILRLRLAASPFSGELGLCSHCTLSADPQLSSAVPASRAPSSDPRTPSVRVLRTPFHPLKPPCT